MTVVELERASRKKEVASGPNEPIFVDGRSVAAEAKTAAYDWPGHPVKSTARRILVIEDEADTLEFLRDLLVQEGFTVATCETPEKGLHEARALHPDLIILDLVLPNMSGMQLLPRLQIVAPHAKVMVLSAHVDAETAQEALGQEVAAVMWKPFKTQTLLQTIARILDLPLPKASNRLLSKEEE